MHVADPGGHLGASPRVGIFDKAGGYSKAWSEASMGATTEAAPYRRELTTTATKTIFESSLPALVAIAVAVPGLDEEGYFLVNAAPEGHQEKVIVAPYVPYGQPFPLDNTPKLPVRFSAKEGERGWIIRLTVDVPVNGLPALRSSPPHP